MNRNIFMKEYFIHVFNNLLNIINIFINIINDNQSLQIESKNNFFLSTIIFILKTCSYSKLSSFISILFINLHIMIIFFYYHLWKYNHNLLPNWNILLLVLYSFNFITFTRAKHWSVWEHWFNVSIISCIFKEMSSFNFVNFDTLSCYKSCKIIYIIIWTQISSKICQ